MVGKIGRVTVTITPAHFGEVIVAVRGGSEQFAATSDAAIPVGTQVVIVTDNGGRTVSVTPFDLDTIYPG